MAVRRLDWRFDAERYRKPLSRRITVKSWTIIGAALLAMLSVSAQAQTSTDPAAGAPAAATPASDPEKPNDVVCRTEKVGGSFFPSRVCHTRAQWNDLSHQSQEMLRGIQRNGGFNNNSTNGG